MRSFAALLAAALVTSCASAPSGPAGFLEILEGSSRVTCRGTGLEGPFGSRLARSAMLVAPSGDRAAWVEIEARALRADSDEGSCQNVSRLWIREGDRTEVAFLQKPGWEGRNGNAIDLVDWSADGSRLLLELHTWNYPTDPVEPTLLVWDSRTRAVEQIDAVTRLAERFGADCALRFVGRGFASDGSIVVGVEAPPDASAACAGGAGLWSVSPSSGEMIPASAVPSRWSSTAAPPPVVPSIDRE